MSDSHNDQFEEAEEQDELEEPKYKMTVNLNVLDHLGINLYSNIAAVLTEAVANAWDADAENCLISIKGDKDLIEISDDGIGMTVNDMNKMYLTVGYKRREDGHSITDKGRKAMGRKGLGKLSLFSIADEIEVQSFKDGECHGLRMETEKIKEALSNQEESYNPEPLDDDEVEVSKGTLIRLRKLRRKRLSVGENALRKRLARRFSILGKQYDFNVEINDEGISIEDRGDLPKVQFLWHFGKDKPDIQQAKKLIKSKQLPSTLPEWKDKGWKVSGWLGTSELPKDLDDSEAGNLNSIVVLARERLFHENILDKLNDGRLYTKYITGQINADFLDTDNEPDIATSDRQRIQEDDPRYISLMNFLKAQCNKVENDWSDLRRKHGEERAKQKHPALKTWLEKLPEGHKKSAGTLIAKISALPLEKDEDRKLMYKHGVLAFERMKFRGSTAELTEGIDDLGRLLELLAGRDALEASMYCDIVRSRLEVIQHFIGLVDQNKKEKVLQDYIFDHLWLIDPSWERAVGSERIEETLKKEYKEFKPNLSQKESKGRADIRYRTVMEKHIIAELKRAKRLLSITELLDQGQKYKAALEKCLKKTGKQNPDIEIVFILGRELKEADNPSYGNSYIQQVLRPLNARIVYYDQMIHGAEKAYGEYLKKHEEFNEIDKLIKNI